MCAYTYTHTIKISLKKEAVNLKEAGRSIWEDMEEVKSREKCSNEIIIS